MPATVPAGSAGFSATVYRDARFVIRRLPGWLAAISRESPPVLPRALVAAGYGDGFWPDGVWRSSGTM
jgi:hypothetical protein